MSDYIIWGIGLLLIISFLNVVKDHFSKKFRVRNERNIDTSISREERIEMTWETAENSEIKDTIQKRLGAYADGRKYYPGISNLTPQNPIDASFCIILLSQYIFRLNMLYPDKSWRDQVDYSRSDHFYYQVELVFKSMDIVINDTILFHEFAELYKKRIKYMQRNYIPKNRVNNSTITAKQKKKLIEEQKICPDDLISIRKDMEISISNQKKIDH